MAVTKAKKSTKNKNSRLSRIIKTFDPSSKRGMLMLYLLVFAIVGGGYLAYQALAASYPPSRYRKYIVLASAKATDGVAGETWCIGTAGNTLVGPLAPCVQSNPYNPSTARLVSYSTAARTYTPTTAWVSAPAFDRGAMDLSNSIAATKCRNINYYFLGNLPKLDIFGIRSFGWIYRNASYNINVPKWQVRNANMDSSGNCSSSGNWLDAVTWDNIQTN